MMTFSQRIIFSILLSLVLNRLDFTHGQVETIRIHAANKEANVPPPPAVNINSGGSPNLNAGRRFMDSLLTEIKKKYDSTEAKLKLEYLNKFGNNKNAGQQNSNNAAGQRLPMEMENGGRRVGGQKPAPDDPLSPDRIIFYDQFFGLVDAPGNEFHMWHAPYPKFGSVWPMPKLMESQKRFLELSRTKFTIKADKISNYILQEAFTRYRDLILEHGGVSYYPREWQHQEWQVARAPLPPDLTAFAKLSGKLRRRTGLVGELRNLVVTVNNPGRGWPHLDMIESYTLDTTESTVTITAEETWGALRGLETFSQLVWQTRNGRLFMNMTKITDEPRFKHRGLLFDTARHYIHKDVILKNLDAMAYNKMNVFHWHMVDDQSFPFQSRTFPNLSFKGAYDHKNMIYTYDDIKSIIEYARVRGIRVVPEFDSPGHTYSWSKGAPEIMTKCYDGEQFSGFLGPLNPAKNATFEFLSKLFAEITDLFQDDYIHIGADEVGTRCWESNPEIQKLMKQYGLDRVDLVVDYYFRRLQNEITKLGLADKNKKRAFLVWQEAYDNSVKLKEGTIVQVWKGDSPTDSHNVARAGHRTIYSACWYLDRLEYGHQWIKYYQCDPGTDEVSGLPQNNWINNLLGGEACMWSEYQTDNTILERIWPLTSAVAERLWSPGHVKNIDLAGPRIEEMRCRMQIRGIDIGVSSGPGMCEFHNVSLGAQLPYRARDLRHISKTGEDNHLPHFGALDTAIDYQGQRLEDAEQLNKNIGQRYASVSYVVWLLLLVVVIGLGAYTVWFLSKPKPSSTSNQHLLLRLLANLFTRRRSFFLIACILLIYIYMWTQHGPISRATQIRKVLNN